MTCPCGLGILPAWWLVPGVTALRARTPDDSPLPLGPNPGSQMPPGWCIYQGSLRLQGRDIDAIFFQRNGKVIKQEELLGWDGLVQPSLESTICLTLSFNFLLKSDAKSHMCSLKKKKFNKNPEFVHQSTSPLWLYSLYKSCYLEITTIRVMFICPHKLYTYIHCFLINKLHTLFCNLLFLLTMWWTECQESIYKNTFLRLAVIVWLHHNLLNGFY